ncbi:MAG: Single-stranded-DNA-specific exonuclease RecJ [Calditrichaeota bacterium]|nr:Single-stranded-DNA-specific exonuclease RecJ [Calditrichota bacterium]
MVARLLMQRGITTPEQAGAFFKPARSALHDPFLFRQMDVAVDRIIRALREKQLIYVFGDYDVDGITSASLLYLFFRDLGGNVRYYIPNREEEGYGVSREGVEIASAAGADLLITVDCGITAVDQVRQARAHGMDIIVSDHHQAGDQIPDALAVINPKLPGSMYPFSELAGCGVAFKLAQAVAQTLDLGADYLDRYLDLVAVGTAADIVPLVDENRILVHLGLEKLNRDPLVGLSALIETAHLRGGQTGVGQIIYGIAPRINAVGRLGSADRAVNLMITQNAERARVLSLELEQENRTRRRIDTVTLDEAVAEAEQVHDPAHDYGIVLAREDWHGGVIGIVASRMIERYYRPTVMITVKDGIGKGSARSIPGFDIYEALNQCSDLLEQFGGHTYAAGLSIRAEKIGQFRERFNRVATETLSEDDLVPRLHIDAELPLEQVDDELLGHLQQFAPFGPDNPVPSFVSLDVALSGYPRIVGGNHLKFKVRSSRGVIDCIGFNLGDRLQRMDPNRASNHIVYTVQENEWMGRVYLQLHVQDVLSGPPPVLGNDFH